MEYHSVSAKSGLSLLGLFQGVDDVETNILPLQKLICENNRGNKLRGLACNKEPVVVLTLRYMDYVANSGDSRQIALDRSGNIRPPG